MLGNLVERGAAPQVAQRDIWCSYRNAFAVHSDEPGFSDVFLRQTNKKKAGVLAPSSFLSSATFTDSVLSIPGPAV